MLMSRLSSLQSIDPTGAAADLGAYDLRERAHVLLHAGRDDLNQPVPPLRRVGVRLAEAPGLVVAQDEDDVVVDLRAAPRWRRQCEESLRGALRPREVVSLCVVGLVVVAAVIRRTVIGDRG